MPEATLVEVRGATKEFRVRAGFGRSAHVRALDDVSFDVRRAEALAVVGETGCGKSTLARSVVRLLPLTRGTLTFDGREITHLSARQMRPIRRDMQLVFQDAFSSLNPRHRVGDIVGEALRIHDLARGRDRRRRVEELLSLVGLNTEHYDRFPRDFSGGQRQRVSIARALAVSPKLLVLDEPVSALDVSIQAQIVNLLLDLRDRLGLTYVFISHDLGLVQCIADRVLVLYLGRVVEEAPASRLFRAPRHHYTASLLSATPVADPDIARATRRAVLTGDPPSPISPPSGCPFHPRCPRAESRCAEERPMLEPFGDGAGRVACHFPLDERSR